MGKCRRIEKDEIHAVIAGLVNASHQLMLRVALKTQQRHALTAGQGGEPLTLGEGLVLHRIVDTIEDVFDFFEDLIDPIDELVILGMLL